MKKVFFVFGVLLSLGMFCACSSDDEVNSESSDGIVDLTPIENNEYEGDDLTAISEFFRTAFSGEYYEPKPFDFRNNLSNKENPCIIVNNDKEFEEAYTGDLPLPTIDFSKYTLIIGKIVLGAGSFFDDVININIVGTKATLVVNCIIDTKGWYIAIEYDAYYWKLFPKFQASEINVEIRQEIGEIDDSKNDSYE